MSFVSAADIFKLCQGAWRLWEFAFSQAKNAEKQYADFGVDIQYLAKNLEKLSNVIQDASKQVPSLSPQEHAWDLKSLPQICGDFQKTLKDCEKLLQDENKFGKGRGGFIYNIQWNLTIEPEVARLRDRVAFHNIKISTVLKPLGLKLLLDLKNDINNVHGDIASRITEVHNGLRRIEGHLAKNNDEATLIIDESPPEIPRVPEYLEIRFQTAVTTAHSELQNDARFPLGKGINAFHHHFEQGTCKFQVKNSSLPGDFFAERTPEPTQYLNLMKSIWIIQQIKKGEDYKEASSDRLWDCYVKELDEKCQREFYRFTGRVPPSERLKEPDRRNLNLLREEEFRIWLDDDEDDNDDSGMDFLNEIFHVLLSSSVRNQKQELVLLRQSDTNLVMHNLSSKTTGPPNRQAVITDINLKKAHLIPLYAYPDSSPEAFNIGFKSDAFAERSSAFSFVKLKDLLHFQQAITGYRVVFDESDIKLCSYVSTGLFRGGKKTWERGRVQIWNQRQLERPSPANQTSLDSWKQRRSVATGSSSAPSVTKSISTAYTSPVETMGSSSVSFQMPGLPILVFYLASSASASQEMSFLSVQMDQNTVIKGDSCECGTKKIKCIHSTIERSGELVARRVEAIRDDEELNLASLGVYQLPKHPDLVKKLKWVHIDFKTHEDRIRFDEAFNQTRCIYTEKLYRYWEEMKREKERHLA